MSWMKPRTFLSIDYVVTFLPIKAFLIERKDGSLKYLIGHRTNVIQK